MVFATGNVSNANVFHDLYDLITLIGCTVWLFPGYMSEFGTFFECIAIIKRHLVGCQDSFTCFTIGQLTELG